MKKITCYCEKTFEKDIDDSFDLDKQPEIYEEILNGNFMSVQCPECKTTLKPEFPFKIIQDSRNIEIFFIPELDRNKYLMKKTDFIIPDSNRIVIGYKELVEKLTIINSDLNDQIIELLKYQILIKFLDSEDDNTDIQINFKNLKQDLLYFHIESLKPDEIGIYKLPMQIYNKIDLQNKLDKQPYSDFLTPPYVSINKIYQENSLWENI